MNSQTAVFETVGRASDLIQSKPGASSDGNGVQFTHIPMASSLESEE